MGFGGVSINELMTAAIPQESEMGIACVVRLWRMKSMTWLMPIQKISELSREQAARQRLARRHAEPRFSGFPDKSMPSPYQTAFAFQYSTMLQVCNIVSHVKYQLTTDPLLSKLGCPLNDELELFFTSRNKQ